MNKDDEEQGYTFKIVTSKCLYNKRAFLIENFDLMSEIHEISKPRIGTDLANNIKIY